MGWDRMLVLPNAEILAQAIDDELEEAKPKLLGALQRGSAVKTGLFRDSWEVENTGTELLSSNDVPYLQYAPLDDTEAQRVALDLCGRLGARVDTTFGRGG